MRTPHLVTTARTGSAVAFFVVAMLALSACLGPLGTRIGPQPLAPSEAADYYEKVRTDVIAAVGGEELGFDQHDQPFVEQREGRCLYDPGSWQADAELFTTEESSWKPLLAPLNDALRSHGFDEVTEFERTGDKAFGISVQDDHNLRLRLYTVDGTTVLSLHGAVIDGTGECTLDELGH